MRTRELIAAVAVLFAPSAIAVAQPLPIPVLDYLWSAAQPRQRLLERLMLSNLCYEWPESDEELAALIEETDLLPIPLIGVDPSR
jgi:hypothetical protein